MECLVNPGGSFFRLEDLDRETLRSPKFDLALVPCSTIRRLAPSYYNIDAIVAATGALRVVYFYSDRQAVLVDPEFLELKEKHLIRLFIERKRETIAELAQYTGESPETVERKCELAGLRAVRLWHQQAPRTEEEIRRYYQENDFYLYELMKTEYNGDEAEISAEVVSLCRPEERVLEYGGGGGTLSIALAEKGCRVTHLDLPGTLLDFAAWRHRRRGLKVRSWPLVDESVLGGPYDTVVSLYVLEHLAEPERTLANIGSALAPRGRLLLAVDYEESAVKSNPLPLHLNRISRERCHEVLMRLGLTFSQSRGDLEIYTAQD